MKPYLTDTPRNKASMLSLLTNSSTVRMKKRDKRKLAMAMDIRNTIKNSRFWQICPDIKDNVKISIHENQLLIGQLYTEKEEKTAPCRRERYSGGYRRNLLLPDNASWQDQRQDEDGVLRLVIPETTYLKEIVIE